MTIRTVQSAIVAVMQELLPDIKAVYEYPIAEVGRTLPAIAVVFDGFEQDRARNNRTWRYELTLFLPADGKRLDNVWGAMVDLIPQVLDAFNSDPALGGTCWRSLVTTGDPVIHIPQGAGSVQFIGHTFTLEAQEYTP